jgi:hypothetical protein
MPRDAANRIKASAVSRRVGVSIGRIADDHELVEIAEDRDDSQKVVVLAQQYRAMVVLCVAGHVWTPYTKQCPSDREPGMLWLEHSSSVTGVRRRNSRMSAATGSVRYASPRQP